MCQHLLSIHTKWYLFHPPVLYKNKQTNKLFQVNLMWLYNWNIKLCLFNMVAQFDAISTAIFTKKICQSILNVVQSDGVCFFPTTLDEIQIWFGLSLWRELSVPHLNNPTCHTVATKSVFCKIRIFKCHRGVNCQTCQIFVVNYANQNARFYACIRFVCFS